MMAPIKSERHQLLLAKSLLQLKNSKLSPYIKDVVLYGSCARNAEKWDSDVDILIELLPGTLDNEFLYDQFRNLQSSLGSSCISDPDIDARFVSSDSWRTLDNIFYKNIQKEGKSVWK